MYIGLNVNRLWFLSFNDAPLILDNFLRLEAFQAKHSPRFLESREGLATEPEVLQFL
jgi:hypothetical protein